jgi:DNA-binding response OmpR family regulator
VRDALDAGRTRCALIADSDPAVWTTARSALADLDMRLEVAGSATEALSKARAAKNGYDVIILDDALEDHPGTSLASELRALNASQPLVITSRKHGDHLKKAFASDPCVAILQRPYSAGELEHALRALDINCVTPSDPH